VTLRCSRRGAILIALAVAGLGGEIPASGIALAGQPVAPIVNDGPVVVELFTSEGCSSCPPADALLGRLAARQDVLPLAFHVDYWNYLGWRDPYSSALATQRQHDYSQAIDAMVYTPQMVVGGVRDAVGSDEAAVRLAIDVEMIRPKLKLAVSRDAQGGYRVAIPGGATGQSTPASVYVALYDRSHETPVGRGENSGRTLTEFNIVRQWRKIGEWTGAPAEIELGLQPGADGADSCAIIIQDGDNGPIRGATAFRLRETSGG
jgi:hypothetical protein